MSQTVLFPYFDPSLSRVALPEGVAVLDLGIPNPAAARLYTPLVWPLSAVELQSRLSAFDALSTEIRGKSEMELLRAEASRSEQEATSFALRQAIADRSKEDEAQAAAREALAKAQVVLGLAMRLGLRQKEAMASSPTLSTGQEKLSHLLDSDLGEAGAGAAETAGALDVDALEEFEVPLVPTMAAFCQVLAEGDALLVAEPAAAGQLRDKVVEKDAPRVPTDEFFKAHGLSGRAEDFEGFAVKDAFFLPRERATGKNLVLLLPRAAA